LLNTVLLSKSLSLWKEKSADFVVALFSAFPPFSSHSERQLASKGQDYGE
jgi:hypothetical protein